MADDLKFRSMFRNAPTVVFVHLQVMISLNWIDWPFRGEHDSFCMVYGNRVVLSWRAGCFFLNLKRRPIS